MPKRHVGFFPLAAPFLAAALLILAFSFCLSSYAPSSTHTRESA